MKTELDAQDKEYVRLTEGQRVQLQDWLLENGIDGSQRTARVHSVRLLEEGQIEVLWCDRRRDTAFRCERVHHWEVHAVKNPPPECWPYMEEGDEI